MLKRVLCLALAFTVCMGMMTAFAVSEDEVVEIYKDHRGREVAILGGADSFAESIVEFIPGSPWTWDELDKNPEDILGVPDRAGYDNGKALTLGAGGVIVLEFKRLLVNGEGDDIYVFEVGDQVEDTMVEVSADLENWYYVGRAKGSTASVDLGADDSEAPADLKYKYVRLTDLYEYPTGNYPGADVDAVACINSKPAASGSAWANDELAYADMLNLIPEVLVDTDLTQDITRAEFAAVCVKVYENLSGVEAIPAVNNPFEDCNDVDVLKAYNIDAVLGTSATTFDPDLLLNREQAATMLTNVFKKVALKGWTQATAGQYTLDYDMPAPFADDAKISWWAKDSVYFMAANEIISGTGNGCFAPRNITDRETAEGYANATREQALLIAVRMVNNLG